MAVLETRTSLLLRGGDQSNFQGVAGHAAMEITVERREQGTWRRLQSSVLVRSDFRFAVTLLCSCQLQLRAWHCGRGGASAATPDSDGGDESQCGGDATCCAREHPPEVLEQPILGARARLACSHSCSPRTDAPFGGGHVASGCVAGVGALRALQNHHRRRAQAAVYSWRRRLAVGEEAPLRHDHRHFGFHSRSCKLWAVDSQAQTLREVDAHAYASLQDVPVGSTTGIRAALSTFVSESERRAAVAQGAHAGVTAALTYKFLPEKQPGDSVSILELDAGISIGQEGVEGMGFKQEAVFTAEAVEKCRVGFKRAWRPPPDSFPLWSHGEATKARIQRLDPPDMAWAGLRCAPWSSAQTVPPEGRTPSEERERALTEMHSIVTNLVAARPKCIILETAANAASLADWWPRIQSVVGSDHGYTWQWQVICPHVHLGRRVRRARLWMVGTPARQCTAASSSTH